MESSERKEMTLKDGAMPKGSDSAKSFSNEPRSTQMTSRIGAAIERCNIRQAKDRSSFGTYPA